MKTFVLPDLGEGLTEAEIVEWFVSEGEEVKADQNLVAVETDKAIVDIPSPHSGRIEKLFAAVGDIVETGKPLVGFAGDGAQTDDSAGDTASDETGDSGTVVGEVVVGDTTLEEKATTLDARSGSQVKATPAIRALARQLDVDLAIVSPSGPNNSVTAEDVRRVQARLEALGAPEILRGARRVMARKMAQSGNEVVPATIMDDADVDAWSEATDITIRLVGAILAGCRAEPVLNAWFDSYSTARRVLENIDIAIAVDTQEGLFTPVLRDVASRDDDDLRDGLEKLKEDVISRKVPGSEMRDYTITLSNFGMIAGRYSTPVIVPPTVAILGAGRIDRRPVVVDDNVVAHRVLPISLTFDHRAVTGGEAGRFLAAVIESLES